MALAAAVGFEAPGRGLLVCAVVVDHGWRADSAAVSATVAERLRASPATRLRDVVVTRVDCSGPGGPEAAARRARYAALEAEAERRCGVVLLGHTRDDQAETVLLGLARGSGPRSLAAMRPVSGRLRRPLLEISRAQTEQACRAQRLDVWSDPANTDRRLLRVRVRETVLPVLEAELGPGVASALARSAALFAADVDALDALATEAYAACQRDHPRGVRLAAAEMAGLPVALRRRVLRLAALDAGALGGELSAVHVGALDDLAGQWRGTRTVDLPGRVVVTRDRDGVLFAPLAHGGGGRPPARPDGPAH